MAVTAYIPERQLFRVLTLDGLQRPFNVPRIYLYFKAENPASYATRVKAAVDLRNETENRIK